jgi:hypothetical protein
MVIFHRFLYVYQRVFEETYHFSIQIYGLSGSQEVNQSIDETRSPQKENLLAGKPRDTNMWHQH